MALYARKLRYGAHDGESGAHFMALVEISHKKGGKPIEFVLYRHIIQYFCSSESRTEMVRLKAKTSIEAIRRFWPWDEKTGKEFPGHHSDKWQKTNLWLYTVAVGGGYERVPEGRWVKITCKPIPRSKRRHRKKRSLQFGSLHDIHRMRKACVENLQKEEDELLEAPDSLAEEIAKIGDDIEDAENDLENIEEEMRQKVRRMFPTSLNKTPRRVLRQRKEEKSRELGRI